MILRILSHIIPIPSTTSSYDWTNFLSQKLNKIVSQHLYKSNLVLASRYVYCMPKKHNHKYAITEQRPCIQKPTNDLPPHISSLSAALKLTVSRLLRCVGGNFTEKELSGLLLGGSTVCAIHLRIPIEFIRMYGKCYTSANLQFSLQP